MDPGLGLQAASGLVSFLLKTTLEWLVCLLLVRIAWSARGRFNLWLTMLLAFAAQWMWMLAGVLRAALPGPALAAASVSAVAGKRIAVAAPAAGMVAKAMLALLVVYAAVLAWRMLGALAAHVRLVRALRYRSAPTQRVAAAFREVVEQAGTERELHCELWVLAGLTSPATLGWRRPRVIVPPACEAQDEEELKAVFWHELKHVERRDALWNALVRACRDVLWFHPAVHHAVAALNAQRELACDAAVVRDHPHSRDVYATCLVRFARMRDLSADAPIPAIEMASGAALLHLRVRSILSDGAESATSRIARAGRATANLALVGLIAATVPGLSILFAAEQSNPFTALSLASHAPVANKNGTHVSAKAAGAGTGAAASLSPAAPEDTALRVAPTQPDEALAAEHRAALGVLTESTGMDVEETSNAAPGSIGATGRGTAGRASTSSSTSWGAIAVDAAERMGPLMVDRDDDRH